MSKTLYGFERYREAALAHGAFYPTTVINDCTEFLRLCGESESVLIRAEAWATLQKTPQFVSGLMPTEDEATLKLTGHLGVINGCDIYTDCLLPEPERVHDGRFADVVVFLKRQQFQPVATEPN